ncbi:Protein PLANT CADMIUM RESISTANCE like [Quillaja saponaria]|uniref:Protein PLANT CADMIUM RESISTANCE like n=1 Tax=Quillaja saponaria TaxID=32244 RepID=A0AAD7PV23_QUISA|nr:Protein PLANT CADMIUM RESISTANCE like [Quillaja saponaria]
MGDLEKQEKMVEEEAKEEGEKERLLEGVAVLDFNMLCSTVALQTQGKWRKSGTVGDEEEGEEFGGVFRMWEGELFDCFDDHCVALESTFCPCYRFGKNMRRAGFGSSYIQGTIYFILAIGVLLSFITFIVTKQHCYLYLAVGFTITVGAYLGFFRTQIRKKFNIKDTDSSLDDCVYHFACPCCTLCQESRTLEMNNVQDGTWRGRGDTICIGGFGEGSKAIFELHPPPHVSIKPTDHCGMQKSTDASLP